LHISIKHVHLLQNLIFPYTLIVILQLVAYCWKSGATLYRNEVKTCYSTWGIFYWV